MCGVFGIIDKFGVDAEKVQQMGNSIAHRGPDKQDTYFDRNLGLALGHRRLSIIDLSETGNQPMWSRNKRYALAFNGEIYNFDEIRSNLEKNLPIEWRGHSDTEVLLYLIQEQGLEAALAQLHGMFAITLWDTEKKELHLVRDRAGEKPLYYGIQGDLLFWSSELKAFHAYPKIKKNISSKALSYFFKYNYIPAPYSIYENIFKVMPGELVTISYDNFKVTKSQYWSLKNKISTRGSVKETLSESIQTLEEKLLKVVKRQMISDVPLGAFLSGGIDSSLIVSLMQAQSSAAVKSFSIGFKEDRFNEAGYAKKVSQHLKTDHTELYVSNQEVIDHIPTLAGIYDEPFSDSSQLPTFLVSKLAKEKVTVSLSGDAGDELFCGYNRYEWVEKIWNKTSLVPSTLRSLVSGSLKQLSPSSWDKAFDTFGMNTSKFSGDRVHKLAGIINKKNSYAIYDQLLSHWNQEKSLVLEESQYDLSRDYIDELKNVTEKMMYHDFMNYLSGDILVKVDRAAMANSLETRVPFLDHEIIEYAWSLPLEYKKHNNIQKYMLKEILAKYVPRELFERPKMGFGIPIEDWLRGPLKEWTTDLLSPDSIKKIGLIDNDMVQVKLQEHLSGKRNWQYHLWDVLMFVSWHNKYH